MESTLQHILIAFKNGIHIPAILSFKNAFGNVEAILFRFVWKEEKSEKQSSQIRTALPSSACK